MFAYIVSYFLAEFVSFRKNFFSNFYNFFANLAKSLAEEKSIEEEIPLNIKIFKEQDKVQNLEFYKNAAQAYEVMLLLEASEFDTSEQKTQLLSKLLEKNNAYE